MQTSRATLRRLLGHLPQGRTLPDRVWESRHRVVVGVAVVQAVVVGVATAVVGTVHGGSVPGASATGTAHAHVHALAGAAPAALVGLAVAALVVLPLGLSGRRLPRPVRAVAATTSLLATSMVLVDLSGGMTEAHFHFFLMVGLASLYQDWAPLGAAILLVLLHHVGVGVLLSPRLVFDSAQATGHPVLLGAVHAAAVLCLSATMLASWRLHEHQGRHDVLTGLANRTMLRDVVARDLRRGVPVAVVHLDLDDFMGVNDHHGHAAGDEVLRAVAGRLLGCARPGDLVARLGADEFAISVPGVAAAGEAVAAQVLRGLREPVVVDGRALLVRASIGLAGRGHAGAGGADAGEVDALLQDAELAMVQAKRAGGGRVAVLTDGQADRARRTAVLAADLARAVAPGADPAAAFRVHFQALVDLRTGLVSGFEALVRWQHPTFGLVPPLDFVPLAETSGAVVPIGSWVLEEAAARAVTLSAAAGRPLSMSVNVSPRQLEDPGFVDVVEGVLDRTGLAPSRLVLEVTESSLVADVDATVARLEALRALGVRIAIDDFGTGYSSLSYLRSLPADVIKIDRSFVTDLDAGGTAAVLVASVVELAASLGLAVVAEGVERSSQAAVLSSLGCGYAQGYLFARPTADPVVDTPTAPVLPRAVAPGTVLPGAPEGTGVPAPRPAARVPAQAAAPCAEVAARLAPRPTFAL